MPLRYFRAILHVYLFASFWVVAIPQNFDLIMEGLQEFPSSYVPVRSLEKVDPISTQFLLHAASGNSISNELYIR